MVGFSWETSIGLILSLFVILLVSPAGVRRSSDQVISAQVAYGGGYLALSFLLLNTVAYIWFFNEASMSFSINQHFLYLWSGLVSSTFGAVYWVFLCLFFVKKVRSIAGVLSLILWSLLMLYQNYLPEIYGWVAASSELMKLQDEIADYIATGLSAVAFLVLNYLYWTNKYRWAEL